MVEWIEFESEKANKIEMLPVEHTVKKADLYRFSVLFDFIIVHVYVCLFAVLAAFILRNDMFGIGIRLPLFNIAFWWLNVGIFQNVYTDM